MKASIVVVTFNQLERTTRPCLESLLASTNPDDYELVVIDNASQDGTKRYLEELPGRYPQQRIKIQLNASNKGFSGGNNDGIRLAEGDFIVLLNNDTLVEPKWLERLLMPFEKDRRIGMVGPVSNSVGNEQRIMVEGLAEDNYQSRAMTYTERQRGAWFTTQRLGFFCVAIARQVLTTTGLLDENYGLGMFEDDDYCIRVLEQGYLLAVAEDCFVYHKGSVSFQKLASTDYARLFQKNREYFSRKHGRKWSLCDIALAYVAKIRSDMNAHQALRGDLSPELQRIGVRLENFEHLLIQIQAHELECLERVTADPAVTHREVLRSSLKVFARRAVYKMRTEFLHGSWSQRKRFIKTGLVYLGRRCRRLPPAMATHRTVVQRLRSVLGDIPARRYIVLPATVDFGYMEQRPQQLARALAKKGLCVIYGTLNHQEDRVDDIKQVADNLYLLHQHLFPYLSHVIPPDRCVYYCMWPNNVDQCRYVPHRLLLYDYMDDLSLLDIDEEACRKAHQEMLQQADLITVSAQRLQESIPPALRHKTILLSNGVSGEFVERIQAYRRNPTIPPELETFRSGFSRIVGYYGAIAEWFDIDLVRYAATRLPEVGFVFVGPVFGVEAEVAELGELRNIYFHPRVPHDALIPWLMNYDIATIPFVKNAVTDAVSPVKLFEYMAAGKPVVSTDIQEARRYRSVWKSRSPDEYVTMLQEALLNLDNLPYLEMQHEEMELNTWEHRADEIVRRI